MSNQTIIKLIKITIFTGLLSLIFSCNFRPSPTNKTSNWLTKAIFYEVPIKHTASKDPLKFLKNNHIYYLGTMKINTLVFPPPQAIESIQWNRQKEGYYPICDYSTVDPSIGHPDSLFKFIKFVQKKNFKFLIEWPLTYTGKCHKWIQSNPDFYTNIGVNRPAKNIELLNLENPELWDAMLDEIEYWMDDYNIDGIVFQGWDKLPKEGREYFYSKIKEINDIVIISDSEERETPELKADAHLNYQLYNQLQALYKKEITAIEMNTLLQSQSKINTQSLPINFSSTLRLNRKYGPYAKYFRKAYRGLTALTHSTKGLSWMLGGQEIPTSLAYNSKNKQPTVWSSKGHADFFTGLFSFKQANKALWINNQSEYKILGTKNDHIMAFENKHKGFKNVGIYNLSFEKQTLSLDGHLMNLNEYQSHKQIQFLRDSSYNISAWQYVILGNNE